jgi:putative component of membrane protein insertase Oxa1/YidC/SpoIIIJ protein YidD
MKKQIREVKIIDIVNYFGASPFIIGGVWVAWSVFADHSMPTYLWWGAICLAILLTLIFTKRFLIGMVLMYKAFAPYSIRGQCRFEPSCSTYMFMALQKYGILIGVTKGICRICRCKPPYGGVDYP